MNGNQVLRVVAYISIGIGIGVLVNAAWGFIAFGLLALIDATFLSRVAFRAGLQESRDHTSRLPQPRSSTDASGAGLTRPDPKA